MHDSNHLWPTLRHDTSLIPMSLSSTAGHVKVVSQGTAAMLLGLPCLRLHKSGDYCNTAKNWRWVKAWEQSRLKFGLGMRLSMAQEWDWVWPWNETKFSLGMRLNLAWEQDSNLCTGKEKCHKMCCDGFYSNLTISVRLTPDTFLRMIVVYTQQVVITS